MTSARLADECHDQTTHLVSRAEARHKPKGLICTTWVPHLRSERDGRCRCRDTAVGFGRQSGCAVIQPRPVQGSSTCRGAQGTASVDGPSQFVSVLLRWHGPAAGQGSPGARGYSGEVVRSSWWPRSATSFGGYAEPAPRDLASTARHGGQSSNECFVRHDSPSQSMSLFECATRCELPRCAVIRPRDTLKRPVSLRHCSAGQREGH